MPKKKTPSKSAPDLTLRPPADTPVFPPSTQTVLAQLDSENGMTAAEVAESSSLGRSTVTKALSTLHDAGLAVRQDGGFDGTRRIADRWFAAPGATDAVQPDLDTDDPEQPAADDDAQAKPIDAVAETGGDAIGDSDDTATDNVEDEPSLEFLTGDDSEPDECPGDSGPGVDDEPADGQTVDGIPDGEAMPDGPEADEPAHTETAEPDHTGNADAASVPETDELESERADEPDGLAAGGSDAEGDGAVSEAGQPDPVNPVAAPGAPSVVQAVGAEASAARLGKGELFAQVEVHLREHPDRAWTPTAISKVLNRSAGAINNACEKLLGTGAVTTFEDKPRRFQWRNDQDA